MLFIINDSTNHDLLYPKDFGRGHDPSQVPADTGMRALFGDAPDQLQVIPRSEWVARTQEMWETKSTLWHLRQIAAGGQQMPTLDQNGQGFCWCYSITRAVMYNRAQMNQPYKRLSGHAIGCMIKNFRDEGGWCGLSCEFVREKGVPSVDFWTEKSMSRSNDKPETWANALGHQITEGWYDINKSAYDQTLTYDQFITCLLLRIPCAADYNWWGHSVCMHTPVIIDGEVCPKGDNSWTDGWGATGSFDLQGNKARPDGCVAIRAVSASRD